MIEEWRDIRGYEGLYQISNTGLVKSLHSTKTIILVEYKDRDGYSLVGLHKGGSQTTFRVHRLVATHFIPNVNNKPTVNHIDGNKSNNSLTNLNWMTDREQYIHAKSTGLRNDVGESNPSARLNDISVKEIVNLLKNTNYTQVEIASMFGVKRKAISEICRGVNWKHITGGKVLRNKLAGSK